ncbi:MAG: hypothetical protein M0R68_03975 [Bacteroidetes bacterium]|nr:hypothetical protein [Bacteroidota bacterium]
MATLEELRTRVVRIIHDDAYTDDDVDGFINEAYKACAGKVLLPDLMSTGNITVLAGAMSTAIPTAWNFDRNLYLCASADSKNAVKVYSSIALLTHDFPAYTFNPAIGSIEACTATQLSFISYPKPSASEILNCAFYKKVTPLVNDTDVPLVLPEHMHFLLLVSGACAEIFTEKEEGIDGVMINTNKYSKRFKDAIEELGNYFKTGQSRPAKSNRIAFI